MNLSMLVVLAVEGKQHINAFAALLQNDKGGDFAGYVTHVSDC